MSSKDNPCRKFQANIFNKSKCQNCFKPRESHLLNDEDLNKAKPIYGGWLLLAPEGTNFDNPLHRSRKWQRRFFILYEHGLLRYALDEMPSTLPQGTINMNQCSDVIDGEARTGQKNSLCILTPDKEHFIRAESKEIINGWQETLVVYPRTNKQNQKKKRKVEAPTPQEGTLSSHRHSSGNMNGHLEPGPAKVTVTSSSGGSIPCLPSSIAAAEKVPASRSSLWQEERRGRGSIPCSRSASCLSQLGQSYQPPSAAPEEQGSVNGGRKARVESGYFSLEKAKPEPQSPQPPQQLSLSLSSPGGPGAPHRYSSSDTDPLTSPYYPSPDRSGGGDPFPSPRPLYSNGSSTISSSQSSLDSEASSTTPTSAASWDGRGGGGVEWLGGAGRAARDYASLSDVPKAKRLSHREAFRSDKKRQELRVRTRSPGREEVARLFGQERRRSQVIEKFESLEGDNVEQMETSSSSEPPSSSSASATAQRQGRSERRHFPKKQEYSLDSAKEQSMPDVSSSSISSYRRAKSLDRRVTESSMTPDLLNFKKGWMTKLYEEGLWKKHWFVLTDQSLRYYRDSIAEEAADLDGEIDLATCYDVTEYPVQRNYGFQIHTKEGAFTLSAMTSGIRRNWIQAIMKNVRPTIAPDVTRSLPEERVRARAAREISHQPSEELCHTPETPAVQGETKVGDNSNSEQRKSRIRERRREGRSKTFDWAEFRQGQSQDKEEPDGQPEKGTDMVDVSSASSTTSSPSSSPPVSSASSPSSSSAAPLRDPPAAEEELEQERARRREERRRRFQAAPAAAPVTTASPTAGEVKTPEDQDQGRMEVDGPLSTPKSSSEGSRERGKPPDVQTEIEQRWHQVETTPLREEKQVPITTLHSTDPTAERLPPQELANLLDKELEQTQKELAKLQEQNSLLQAQLQDARGREQSAREGYVLQSHSPSSSPPSGAWQRLHKLNQDLQTELEAQRRKQDLTNQQVQALKKNYSEAKDVIRHHESEIQALQAKLHNAMAEILISEQAVAKMRSELKLEQERFRDLKEEWEHNEQALRAQLKDSEDRLKDVEAQLLEKSQALRDLERQQALQRDHLKEVQRLQERLTEVTGRLIATEEAQALKEERLQKNLHILQESQEKERQNLVRRLAEAEGKGQELEERLQDAEQQVETLLREKRTSGLQSSETVIQLEEQLAIKADTIEKLTETIRQLQEEKNQLTCRCQELLNQIAEADNEVTKLQSRLKTEETDYYNLEHSYEKVSEEFQKIHMVLREKEEEIREAKEMYERLMEKKEQDLNEAMIKMAALGSSLEETELKLQAKEQLINKMGYGDMETRSAERDLQVKLVVAEDRITELEQHLNELQLGYSDLQMEHCKLQEDCDVLQSMSKAGESASTAACPSDIRPKVSTSADGGGSLSKRQRIRFSSIHCQKYVHSEEKLWTSSTSSDVSQDRTLSEEGGSTDMPYQYINSGSSDPEKFISIIHALETKLYTTEEKLKDITMKLEQQQDRQLESMMERHGQWTKTEAELREQLSESLSKVDQLTAQLQEEMDKRCHFARETDCSIRAVNAKYEKALACVESSREKVQAILRTHKEDSTEKQLHTLSEIETELVNATVFIRQGGSTSEEQQDEVRGSQNQDVSENKISDEERIKLFAKTLAFEALVLNKMAFSIQNTNVDLLQGLSEIHQEAEKLRSSDEGYVAIAYADVLTRKLMLESEFWAEVEQLEAQHKVREDIRQGDVELVGDSIVGETGMTVINNACIKAELAFAVQNLKHFYEEKLQKLKGDLLEAHRNLQHRELALQEVVKSSKRPDFDRVIQEVSDEFGFSQGKSLADISPPELAPYVEQIKMEEAHDLAEEIVNRHLQIDMPSCTIESVESTYVGQERLAAELRRQAEVLQRLSHEVEVVSEAESSRLHHSLLNIALANPSYSSSSDITSSSLCMREAMIQAQIAYVACKLRADHERDMKMCKEACQSMDVLCQEHARNVGAIRERYEASMQDERQSFTMAVFSLQEENEALKGEVAHRIAELSEQQERLVQLEEHFRGEMEELKARYELELSQVEQRRAATELELMEKTADSQRNLDAILMDIEGMEDRHEEHVQKLEDKFHGKIQELQRIHEEEMQRLHGHYMQTIRSMQDALERMNARHPEESSLSEEGKPPTDQVLPMEEGTADTSKAELDSMMVLRERIQELETQMNTMKDELENKHLEGDVSSLKEKYQKDFESLKATCERGFAAMEETHQKVIEDIQRQHQREVSKLLEERERLLAEETAATIAAIEAMKNAHREELEKTQRSQLSGMSSDIEELRRQYEEELQSIHRELEVLSEQYSQKCLENAHLAQALEAERQALRQCQRENQELNAHNQELNNRLTAEITRMRSCLSGEVAGSPLTQGKDLYELEVLLRVKESEIQYLKQEIHSLKDELQSALRDKKYATDKYKDIYTELSIVKAKADCDISKLKEQLLIATEALGERSADSTTAVQGYDIMKSKSNPDFLKKERSSLTRQIRGVRSKSLKEGLTVQERMKLFEAKDSKKI
ncbi:putative leucine-rich repeat-containing protein DDB_G0290503 isoform X3 [Megalops cyprinoides]|uniref:putative leucine-rich repeat-containing protein DDB_G0290503 isoform X3 n=1 Tax=Megalops cyprinoides TaxID=118141 RepID=UPI0018644A36|nr:putative leucine-rich repeat-containing protein DDB_G0290503 isoform X3 [Megalops cyprinoides]